MFCCQVTACSWRSVPGPWFWMANICIIKSSSSYSLYLCGVFDNCIEPVSTTVAAAQNCSGNMSKTISTSLRIRVYSLENTWPDWNSCNIPSGTLWSQGNPQTPSTSFRTSRPSFSAPCCSFFTRLTRSPKDKGPMIVHSMMAQVTMRNIPEFFPSSARVEANILLLSAIDEIRKPISPRAVIAQPIMAAG